MYKTKKFRLIFIFRKHFIQKNKVEEKEEEGKEQRKENHVEEEKNHVEGEVDVEGGKFFR